MKIKIVYTSEGVNEDLDKRFEECLKDFELIGNGYNFVMKERDLEYETKYDR